MADESEKKKKRAMNKAVSRAFMAGVKNHFRVTAHRDLALELGFTKGDDEVNVGRWARGQYAPTFHYTMKILRAAGWLKPEALRIYDQAQLEAEAAEAERALGRAETEGERQAG